MRLYRHILTTLFVSLLLVNLTVMPDLLQAETNSPVRFVHALSLHGEPALGPDMKHFDYVDPDAPKGGAFKAAQIGSYNTFHLYGPQGKAPLGLYFTHETLLVRNWDEPLSKYGVVTETIELPEDNSWVAFHINPKARFRDGTPITAHDVIFSYQALITKGGLFWRQFYQDIKNAEATTQHRVLFRFHHNKNLELPLLLGQIPVLSKTWWQGRDFSETTLDIPLGSGPYRIHRYEPGRFVEYKRDENYWAKDHPVNRGRFNFDTLRYDFYRDQNIVIEAVNNGQLNWHLESDPRFWNEGFSRKALKQGDLIKSSWLNQNPQIHSLVFNSRRESLKDQRVREALTLLMNFDALLDNLMQGMMKPAHSLFDGTEMASKGLPNTAELKLLSPWQQQLPERLFQESWPPYNQLNHRGKLKQALSLLEQAGYSLKKGVMLTPEGEPMQLEILLGDPRQERLIQSQVKKLADAGIQLTLRTMESARYLKHLRAHDFDMVLHTFRHTPSPGTEQASFWNSQGRNEEGSLNLAAFKSPVIDAITQEIPKAATRAELVTRIKALDRSLLWEFKVIPLLYNPKWRVVYRKGMHPPHRLPRYNIDTHAWWSTP